MKRGEIWIVDAGNSDGHEQFGVRPAVVISDIVGSTVVVIPCTTNPKALKYPFTTGLRSSKTNNLDVDSIALVFQIRAIDIKRLKNKIGVLAKSDLKLLNQQIKKLLKMAFR